MRAGYLAAAGALLLPMLACQTKQTGNPISGAGGGGNSTGIGGSGGKPPPSGKVTVAINMPGAGSIEAAGSVLVMSADVSISYGTDFIDTSSVKALLTPSGSTSPVATGVLSAETANGSTYTGSLSLGTLPTGDYQLTISARSSGGMSADSSVAISINAGPTLIVNSPLPGKHYKKSVVVEVVADPAGFAPLMALDATVAGMPFTLADAGVSNTYRFTIDFNSYDPPLVGDQLLIVSATDSMGQRTEIRLVFNIDNTGPTITMTTPKPEDIVGGIWLFSAVIQDPAGLLDSSVIAVISDDTSTPAFELALKPIGISTYGLLFDTARLTKCPQPPAPGACILYPTVSFRASDALGNETALGYNFRLDNVAPVSDLDPPQIREIKKDHTCSWKFDPLSPELYLGDQPHDGDVVPQVFDLRARIEDDGNTPPGTKEVPISGIDPNATAVFVLDDTTQPLVVDTDGDGVCDDINPLLIPTTTPPTQNNQVLEVRLSPVMAAGGADMTPDPSLPQGICLPGMDQAPPDILCDFQLPAAIGYAHGQSAIWALDPINKGWCFGSQFDTLANNIQPGWACIAVRSYDRLGNRGVSHPLRIYVSEDGSPPPGGTGAKPDCTGLYDMTGKTVSAGKCAARDYKYNGTELCPLDSAGVVDCAAPP
jgi:hypothetical protein